MPDFTNKILNRNILKLIIIFILGAVWLVALRFVTYKDTNVHYHANFAVFVNGERLLFDNFTFYEEVQSCGGDNVNNPKIRVHMHDQINHIVHVHDEASTWGHFFANLGMTAGDTVFKTADDVYIDGQNNTEIKYVLNGENVQTVANRTIQSEDTLLISIGDLDETALNDQYSNIEKDAGEYNDKADPSACTGSKDISFTERLKIAIGFID